MKLSACMRDFFDDYLYRMKGVSENSIKSYRETLRLFARFAAEHLSVKVGSLRVEHLRVDVVVAFLDHLEQNRGNAAVTRNQRLAALKSMAKMIRLMYPEYRKLAEAILNIPQKRARKPLVGFLYPEEAVQVFEAVDLKKPDGFRDYTILHLLYDSGARASECAALERDHFDEQQRTMIILGKGNRFRQVDLWPRTTELLSRYITRYRRKPQVRYQHYIFINQRGQVLSRHGIYGLCRKYLRMALPPKRIIHLNPAHCFRHACAVYMLSSGFSVTDIRNRLGHADIQTTMAYIHLDLSRRRKIQDNFVKYTQDLLKQDPKIDELIDWENKQETLAWLDSL